MKTKRNYQIVRKIIAMAFILAMLCGVNMVSASAATRKCYLIKNQNTTVYKNTGLTRKLGTVYGSDEIIVKSVTSSYCKVTYPISSGKTKTGYISTSAILTATFGNTYSSRKKITTYRRPGGVVYGYIAYGDSVMILGTYGNYTQVKYPVSGGYKYAFVKTSDANNYIKPGNSNNDNYATITEGTYKIATALNTSYCLDVHNFATSDGGNVEIYPYHGTTNEQWKIQSLGSGYYRIVDTNSGKSLDVNNGSSASGTNVQIWTSNNTNAQKWAFISAGNGYYYIKNANGCYLDVSEGKVANAQNVWVYTLNKTKAQKWKLTLLKNDPVPSSTTYAAYTGVRYDNKGLSSQRVAALKKAQQLVTIQWTAPATFPTWCSKSGVYNRVTATDGTRSTNFIQGKTYTGVPYSMVDNSWTDDTLKSSLGRMTSSYMTGYYYSGKKTTAHGIDCSYFVYTCFKTAVPSYGITYQTTGTMLKSRYYSKISLSAMKPGDIFLKSGHVMMFVGKSGSKYAVFEADANDSKASYNVYSYSYIKSYGCYRFKGFSD